MRLLLRPRLAVGEAYMEGTLTTQAGGDIYDLLDLLGRNMAALEATPSITWSYGLAADDTAPSSSTTRSARAEKNVAHHYDLKDQSTASSSTATGSIPAPTSPTAT